MSKYIDTDKLITKIKQKIKSIENCPFQLASFGEEKKSEGELIAYKDALSFITSLQQEQPEVDLSEHRIADIIQNLFPTDQFIESESLLLDKEEAILFARYFYELGLNARKV